MEHQIWKHGDIPLTVAQVMPGDKPPAMYCHQQVLNPSSSYPDRQEKGPLEDA